MADKKISALPAATTPLAGTEVLPIVQGGTTDQVSVANLTAGRAVSSLSVTTTQDVTTGRNLIVTGAGRVEQNGGAGGLYFLNTAVSAGATNMRFYTTNASGVAQLQYQLNGGTTPTNQVYGDLIAETGNFKLGTSAKGITNSTGSVLLAFSTAGTTLTGGAQSVLTGSFNNIGTAQTITPADTNGGYIVITGIQPGIGSTTYTLPFVKRGGTAAIGTPSIAILTADPLLSVAASGGDIVVTPIAANTYITYAIYYTPLGA